MAKRGRPEKYKTVLQLQTIIIEYFKECDPHWIDEEYWDYPYLEHDDVEMEEQAHGGALKRVRKKNYSVDEVLMTRKHKTEQQPYTMSGLARRLGLSRQGLMEYKAKDDFSDTIKEARALVEEFNERLLLSGKYATGAIFNLKVNFGFKENEEENKPPENPIIFINNVPTEPSPVTVPPEDDD